MPTTQISLIRLHTEKIVPPRALWVSFELGRPLGVPNDPEFQRRVLMSTLRLFESENGPVLEDFPEDAPPSKDEITVFSCPVDFPKEEVELTETEQLCAELEKEIAAMRPWYDMSVKKRGRTTVGVSGLEIEGIGRFLCSFLDGELPESPREDVSLPYALNLATDDLKAYYFEGITSQPGQESPSNKALSDWFYGETAAGKVLMAIAKAGKKSENGLMKLVGNVLLIPAAQAHRLKK